MADTTGNEERRAPEELDVGSEHFNPLLALYAANYKVTEKAPKVLYQNLAAFETALTKFGVWQLNKRQKTNDAPATKHQTDSRKNPFTADTTRRFEPHQMPIEGVQKLKYKRNLYTHMASAEGPLALLQKYLPAGQERLYQRRLCVHIRKEHGIGGRIEGDLVAFDKQWNLLLKNAIEFRQRRKYKYGQQNICNTSAFEDCSERLHQLGIELPKVHVKSLNRKNVELSRELPQLMVRGEQVAFITFIINAKE
ncbi:U7 snRNA-associated Sm-like protein LSm11 [Drosophila grimshawi]|uniref:GH21330 n=1 Tax=Drosophila grimshawi TaxID=7222 RepID=B4J8B0_DROGR|nr:U7 snRNA-associated Sm-like protein LSm11 [Drosophila grimshawi]EDW01247.1 GH21330 [Drosophila grimshawi]